MRSRKTWVGKGGAQALAQASGSVPSLQKADHHLQTVRRTSWRSVCPGGEPESVEQCLVQLLAHTPILGETNSLVVGDEQTALRTSHRPAITATS